VPYPDAEAERQMLIVTTGPREDQAIEVMSVDNLLLAQRLVRRIPVGDSVVEAILTLVRSGRAESTDLQEVRRHVAWGPGPRASQALMLACRARALLDGRFAPSVDDVIALAHPILRHRMALNFTARADGVTLNDVIERLCGLLR
jgi:MoxR-like ATPase